MDNETQPYKMRAVGNWDYHGAELAEQYDILEGNLLTTRMAYAGIKLSYNYVDRELRVEAYTSNIEIPHALDEYEVKTVRDDIVMAWSRDQRDFDRPAWLGLMSNNMLETNTPEFQEASDMCAYHHALVGREAFDMTASDLCGRFLFDDDSSCQVRHCHKEATHEAEHGYAVCLEHLKESQTIPVPSQYAPCEACIEDGKDEIATATYEYYTYKVCLNCLKSRATPEDEDKDEDEQTEALRHIRDMWDCSSCGRQPVTHSDEDRNPLCDRCIFLDSYQGTAKCPRCQQGIVRVFGENSVCEACHDGDCLISNYAVCLPCAETGILQLDGEPHETHHN